MNSLDNSNNVTLADISGNRHKQTTVKPQASDTLKRGRDGSRTPLTDKEWEAASPEVVEKKFVDKFPRSFKYSADPIYRNQVYSLHSFIPAPGATPDKEGVFGMFKVRATCMTEEEADEHAEDIVRNVDSYNTVYHGYCGKWFPATLSSKYTQEIHEVDITKKVKEVISKNLVNKRKQEKKDIQEIKQREAELRKEVKDIEENGEDPMDVYIELHVKKAHCLYTLERYKKDMLKLEKVCEESQTLIDKLDTDNPEFKNNYMDIYKQARSKVGLGSEKEDFMKYM